MTRLVEEKCKLVNERLHLAVSVAIATSRQRLDPIMAGCTNLANCGAYFAQATLYQHILSNTLLNIFLDILYIFIIRYSISLISSWGTMSI